VLKLSRTALCLTTFTRSRLASERSHLREFFDKFRQQSGYYHRQLAGQRLWQEGYFDRSLRKEEDTFEVVSYILANPVRAGLCQAPVDYPFSGSSRYSLSEIATFVQWRPKRQWRSAKAVALRSNIAADGARRLSPSEGSPAIANAL
jgi:hypothetical protein